MKRRLALILFATLCSARLETPAAPAAHAPRVTGAHSPLRFEANAGQWDPSIAFAVRTKGGPFLISDGGMRLGGVAIRLEGGGPGRVVGESQLPTVTNYYLGNDPARWRTNVPSYERVRATGWRPGVAVVWHAGSDGVEYDLEVAAGIDARQLVLSFDGARALRITSDGSVVVEADDGVLVQKPPRVVQGDRTLATRYVRLGASRVGFAFDEYDPTAPLLVDPVLSYATYLGGSTMDLGSAIAVDGSGNAYVECTAGSVNFPMKNAMQGASGGGWDVSVTKLDPSGSTVLYSTYIGGSGDDWAKGIAVDGAGNAYAAGRTASVNFPTSAALQASNGGGADDAFVTKLSATGTLVYSTYLGGNYGDEANAIAVDASGNAYLAGDTYSTNFPLQSPIQAAVAGPDDAFITKINAAGSALVYSTYLGGNASDQANGIAIDASGNAYVIGTTHSYNYPLKGPLQGSNVSANGTAFVTKVNVAGSALVYSTYLGGSGDDYGQAIAVDATGSAYVTGGTSSPDFPIVSAFQGAPGGTFVTKFNPTGSALTYSTYLGGYGVGYGIGVDVAGSAYVTGTTTATDFPVHNAFQASNGGYWDAFITKLTPSGTSLAYSTYYGGLGDDEATALAISSTGDAYVAGSTASVDLPTNNAFQATNHGEYDAFVARIHSPDLPNGAACNAGECASGNCVDGVCCDTACTGQCEACDVSGSVGTCSPVIGLPHGTVRPACGGVPVCESCDGTNRQACSLVASGTACASSCAASVETDSFCDGLGHCGTIVAHSCNNLVCEADGGTCKTSCGLDDDCVSGFACADAGCAPGARCLDGHTAQPATGPQQDCTPYACATITGCKTQCSSVDDCAPPNVCDQGGHCAPPTGSNSSGCSCEAGPRGTPPWAALAAALLGTLGAVRRRRKT